jgi:hypothetical protein
MSNEARKHADLLRQEAKVILQNLFFPSIGQNTTKTDRLVDCIISAAILEVADLNAQAFRSIEK